MQVHLKCHYCPAQAHNITYLSTLMIAETETMTKAFIITMFGTTCKPRSIHLKGKLTFEIVQAQGSDSFCEIGRQIAGDGKDTGLLLVLGGTVIK